MTRKGFVLGAASLALALSATPLAAGQAGGRPSGGSPSTGTAESRGGGESVSTSSSSSSTPSSSSGSSSTATPSYESPRPSYAREAAMERAPQRPSSGGRPSGAGERGGDRSGDRGGDRAVPRGTAEGGRTAATPSGRDDRMSPPERRAVPVYSRPRDGRVIVGTAGERRSPNPNTPGYFYNPYGSGYYYDPYGYYYYSRYGYYGLRSSLWWPGYGMGLAYFYDPFYDPFWSMGGYGGYGSGYYGSGYYGGGYAPYASSGSYRGAGALRLKVKPRDAEVLVDGYYVGTVDDFDGAFQKLHLDAGGHKIQIRARGYQTVDIDVMVGPGETVTYRGSMRPMP